MNASRAAVGCTAVAVIGMGVSSPIGHQVRAVQVAMAGRIRNFRLAELPGWSGRRFKISHVPDADSPSRLERLTLLVERAVADLCTALRQELPPDLAIIVGCAHDTPDSELGAVAAAISAGSDGLFDPAAAAAFAGIRAGRVAFLTALSKAMHWLEERGKDVALVVAADCRCLVESLEALALERRLLSDRNDGTIPGEGAIAMLVAVPGSSWARQASCNITRPAFAADDFVSMRQSPTACDGLARVFGALAGDALAGAERPQAIVAFGTGEVFFTRAFQTAYLRNAQFMPEPLRHELIASNLGDTGAAAAGMAVLRAEWLLRRGGAHRAPRVLVYGHSDDGGCAAAIVIGRKHEARS